MSFPIVGWGMVVFTLSTCIWVGTRAHAEDRPGVISNSTDMIGKLVKNHDGKNIGKITDLVINWRSDSYIEYAVLSSGGFLGLGDAYVAVPWGALILSENKEHFVLTEKEEHLKAARGFMMYRFYDRSSASIFPGGRSPAARSAQVMKGDVGPELNALVGRSFNMQSATEAEFHR